MIKLTKLNGKEFLVNSDQIVYIDTIPESKITMMNGEYLLVTEPIDEIIDKVVEYKRQCFSIQADMVRDSLTLAYDESSCDCTDDCNQKGYK